MLRRMDSLVPIDYNDMMDTAYRHGNGKHKTNDRNDDAVSARFPPLCDDSDAREGKKDALGRDADLSRYHERDMYDQTLSWMRRIN